MTGKQTTKKSCNKRPTTTNIDKWQQFKEAYEILRESCYIPEKFQQSMVQFLKRANVPQSQLPTKIRILQFKIYVDDRLNYTKEQIYKTLDLK